MTIGAALVSYLANYSGLSALNVPEAYPLKQFQGDARPAITYFRTNEDQVSSFGGATETQYATMQVDAWGDTDDQARAVAAACRDALHGYGPAQMGGDSGLWVPFSLLTNNADEVSDPIFANDVGVYFRVTQTYKICYELPIPALGS